MERLDPEMRGAVSSPNDLMRSLHMRAFLHSWTLGTHVQRHAGELTYSAMISKTSCKAQPCLNHSLGWKAASMSVACNNSPTCYVDCVTVLAVCRSVA